MTKPDEPKMLRGNREELKYQMRLAEEYLYLAGTEPRGGFLAGSGSYPYSDSSISKGTGRSDLNVEQELNPDTGLGIRIWPAQQKEVHPIYGDSKNPSQDFGSPYTTFGLVKYSDADNKSVSTSEFGQKFERTADMYIPFWHHYTEDLPEPRKGDLVEFWAESWDTLGVFYHAKKVSEGEYINNTNYFTEWVLQLTRNDEFVPERRLLGER